MYNALTGRNEKIGNWAGVTVDKKESQIKKAYYADGLCAEKCPELREISAGHFAACHHLDKVK